MSEKNDQSNLMSPLCGAKARTNGHLPCRRIAMANGRCNLHGGLVPKHNTGPKTEEGRLRQRMGNWKHGMRSKAVIEENRRVRQLIKGIRESLAPVLNKSMLL